MSPDDDDGASKPGRNPKSHGDYEVGYGRPPRERQFKKGEPSRNPKGRPRGRSRPAPDLVGALLQTTTFRIQGKERTAPFLEVLIQVMKSNALRGDQRAATTVLNLARELDLLKPKEEFAPVTLEIHFDEAKDKGDE
jgi:Family of unknown function (DUF5681)